MTSYNFYVAEQRIVNQKYHDILSTIQTQYESLENLLDGKINSITISFKNIIKNIVHLYILNKDISSISYSDDPLDNRWAILAQKCNTEICLKDSLLQMKIDIGELLYPYLLKIYNAFSCDKFTCSRDITNVDEYYYISETDSHVLGGKMQEYFNDLRRLLTGLEVSLKIRIITPNAYQGLPKKVFSASPVIVTRDEARVNAMKLKLNKYKIKPVETKYIKRGKLDMEYENEFMLFDCYETSNTQGITSKMWSLIFYPKKDFQHLKYYVELSKITRLEITKVRDNSGRWAIRFYDMCKNPGPITIVEILEYIFKGIIH